MRRQIPRYPNSPWQIIRRMHETEHFRQAVRIAACILSTPSGTERQQFDQWSLKIHGSHFSCRPDELDFATPEEPIVFASNLLQASASLQDKSKPRTSLRRYRSVPVRDDGDI